MFWRAQLLSIVAIIGSVLTDAANAAEPVTLRLDSGRTLTGIIDSRSDDNHLWLLRGDEQASIARPVEWQRIVSAIQNHQQVTVAELQAQAKSIAQKPEPIAVELPRWRGVFATSTTATATLEAPISPVRSLAIDAFAANWDSDLESDGIVVAVYPLDALGQVVPVTGSLEVELIAPEVRQFHDTAHGRGLTLERIGQWTSAIQSASFGPNGVRVELPYQALHPEFDTKILPQALVHARLVVPGQGTFDASSEFIRIRPWSPLRDKYWRDTGRRFFPNEQTGRAKRVDP